MAQPSGSSVFVFDDTSKENSRPVKSGRAPGSTFGEKRTVFGSNAGIEKARADKRAEHLRAIENTAGSDKPLDAWLAYIRWIQAEYPTGGLESDLLPSLEKVTRLYANDPRFKNEPDYIKLWVTYADLLADPGDVFRYMRERGIGSTVSLYYMAWAWLAEHRGDFSSADQIYSLGISCGALPIDRLKLRYKEFQRRMYKKWINAASNNNNTGGAMMAATASRAAPSTQQQPSQQQPQAIPALSAAQLASLSTATGPSTMSGGARSSASAAVAASSDENGRAIAPASAAPATSALTGLGYDHLSGLSAPVARAPLGQVSEAGAALSYRPAMDRGDGEDGGATEMRNGVVQMRRPQQQQQQPLGQARQLQQQAAPQAAAQASTSSSSQAPGFAVFEEEPAADGRHRTGVVMGSAASSSSSSSSSSSHLWAVLPTEKERKKENTQAPLKWTDPAAILPSKNGAAATSGAPTAPGSSSASSKESAFLVYEEDGDDAPAAPAPPAPAPAARKPASQASAPVAASKPAAAPVIMNPRLLEAMPSAPVAKAPVVAPVAAPAPPQPTPAPAAPAPSSLNVNASVSYEEDRAALWFSRNPSAKAAIDRQLREIEEEAAVAAAKAKQMQHRAALATRGNNANGDVTSSTASMMTTSSTMMMSMAAPAPASSPRSPIPAGFSNAAAAAAASQHTFGLSGMSPIAPLGEDAKTAQYQYQYQLPHTIHGGASAAVGTANIGGVGFVAYSDEQHVHEQEDFTRGSVVSDFGKDDEAAGGIAPYLLAPPRHQQQRHNHHNNTTAASSAQSLSTSTLAALAPSASNHGRMNGQQQAYQSQFGRDSVATTSTTTTTMAGAECESVTARLSSVEELKFLLDEANEEAAAAAANAATNAAPPAPASSSSSSTSFAVFCDGDLPEDNHHHRHQQVQQQQQPHHKPSGGFNAYSSPEPRFAGRNNSHGNAHAAAEAADREDQTLHSRLADAEIAELFSSPSLPAAAMSRTTSNKTAVKGVIRAKAVVAAAPPPVPIAGGFSSENGPMPATSAVHHATAAPFAPRGPPLSSVPLTAAPSVAPPAVPQPAAAAAPQGRMGPGGGRLPPPGARRLSAAVLKRAGGAGGPGFEIFTD